MFFNPLTGTQARPYLSKLASHSHLLPDSEGQPQTSEAPYEPGESEMNLTRTLLQVLMFTLAQLLTSQQLAKSVPLQNPFHSDGAPHDRSVAKEWSKSSAEPAVEKPATPPPEKKTPRPDMTLISAAPIQKPAASQVKAPKQTTSQDKAPVAPMAKGNVIFQGSFGSDWQKQWGVGKVSGWVEPRSDGKLRVHYPKGSLSPSDTPGGKGGGGFYKAIPPTMHAMLEYEVTFPPGWDTQGRGGKLPGLASGSGINGGNVSTNGFSARPSLHDGHAYVYQTGKTGIHFGREALRAKGFKFEGGKTYKIQQEVDVEKGIIRQYVNGQLVVEEKGLNLGTRPISVMHFSTFFGGNQPKDSSPKDQYADFANFKITNLSGSQDPAKS